jgi:phage tail-like protein
VVGGFSDVSGLGVDVSYSEYRNGNEKFNTVRKVPNTHKNDDVTLKRGLVGSDDLFQWLKGVRDGTADPRTITITLLDEARQPVATWALRNAQPKKWTGPTLAAKGGGEVAMEEISLVHEGIEYK